MITVKIDTAAKTCEAKFEFTFDCSQDLRRVDDGTGTGTTVPMFTYDEIAESLRARIRFQFNREVSAYTPKSPEVIAAEAQAAADAVRSQYTPIPGVDVPVVTVVYPTPEPTP